jgi:uncharacterized protein (DUF983 family)
MSERKTTPERPETNGCLAKCPHCGTGECDNAHDRNYHHCGFCGKHWVIS